MSNSNNLTFSFYGLCPRMTKTDILYKVYICHNSICGVKLAGQIFDKESAEIQLLGPLMIFRFLAIPWVKKLIKKRYEKELLYDSMDFSSSDFLTHDENNFLFNPNQITHMTISNKRRLWTGPLPVAGTIKLFSSNKIEKELIILPNQEINTIVEELKKVVPEVTSI